MSYVSKRFILDKLIFCVSNMYFNKVAEDFFALLSRFLKSKEANWATISSSLQENSSKSLIVTKALLTPLISFSKFS